MTVVSFVHCGNMVKAQGSEQGRTVTSYDSEGQPPPYRALVRWGEEREACILVYLHWRISKECIQPEMESLAHSVFGSPAMWGALFSVLRTQIPMSHVLVFKSSPSSGRDR